MTKPHKLVPALLPLVPALLPQVMVCSKCLKPIRFIGIQFRKKGPNKPGRWVHTTFAKAIED